MLRPAARRAPSRCGCGQLAAAEHARCGGPGVGAVGMCFTGGFALAMMVDDIMLAPVLSQPSLPFPITRKHKADIGISDADLARVKERTAEGPVCWDCASPTTPSASRSASPHCDANWVTPSSPSRSTRRRAIPTDTRRRRTPCSPSTSRTRRGHRRGPCSIRPWRSSGRSWAWEQARSPEQGRTA